MKSRQKQLGRAGVVAVLATAVFQACGDGSAEISEAGQVADRCLLASDCGPGLICAFTYCHIACTEDRDCRDQGVSGRCVPGENGGHPICQLDTEIQCDSSEACLPNTACAPDGQCREQCAGTRSCAVADLSCSLEGFCARSSELKASGELSDPPMKPKGAGLGGTSSGGKSGASSGGTSVSALGGAGGDGTGVGGASGGGASGGSTEPSSAGATPTGGAGGDDGAPNGNGGSGGDTETSGGQSSAGQGSAGAGNASGGSAGTGNAPVELSEAEPNDSFEQATFIPLQSSVDATLSDNSDNDYFEVMSPSGNAAGGYFEIGITNIPNGRFTFDVLLKSSMTSLYSTFTSKSGDAAWAYFAAAPATAYVFRITPLGDTLPYDYRVHVSYSDVPDSYEPNDTRTAARAIELGVPVQGYLFAGFKTDKLNTTDYEDWYEVTLEAGLVRATLTSVPPATSTALSLHGPSGSVLASSNRMDSEADNAVEVTVTTPGTHWLKVTYYTPVPAARGRLNAPGAVPANFVDPYTLTVTQ